MHMIYSGNKIRIPSSKELGLKRDFSGYYATTDGQYVITLNDEKGSSWYGEWVVSSNWDKYDVSDPIATFAEAKISLGVSLGINMEVA